MANMITVGGNALPEGNVYDVGIKDIVSNTFRDVNSGLLNAEYIATKVTIDVNFPYLTKTQYSCLLGKILCFIMKV